MVGFTSKETLYPSSMAWETEKSLLASPGDGDFASSQHWRCGVVGQVDFASFGSHFVDSVMRSRTLLS